MIDIDHYKRDREVLRNRLVELTEQREALDKEIAYTRKAIGSLSEIIGDDSAEGGLLAVVLGLTESCREVLRASSEALTAGEVMDAMIKMGLSNAHHPNLLASIHTTLRRMSKGERCEALESLKGEKKAYRLKVSVGESMRRVVEETRPAGDLSAESLRRQAPTKRLKAPSTKKFGS